jgi:aryl-alcohol dehydrogenase-like predicted oxidoreductase
MEMRTLGGSSGIYVSLLGLGCNNFGDRLDRKRSLNVIHAAIDAGLNFLDTAPIYGSGQSEEIVGNAVRNRRPKLILATKFGYPQPGESSAGLASAAAIVTQVEASLRRLRTDYIDLLQLHLPDLTTPWEETLAALDRLQQLGKVRCVGAANLDVTQISLTDDLAAVRGLRGFVCHQNEMSALHSSASQLLLPNLERRSLGFLPYFPLANGLLTGKYGFGMPLPEGTRLTQHERWRNRYLTDGNLRRVSRLRQYAETHGRTLLELALGWLAGHPAVRSVIAGAMSSEQVHGNATSLGWTLSGSEIAEVVALVEDTTGPDA